MQTLIKFKNFVDELNLNNSRNYKISILDKYKKDNNIKFYLQFAFDPYIITGISDKKLNKDVKVRTFFSQDVKDLLIFLIDHNTGTDEIIGYIQDFKRRCITEDLWPLFDALVTKNLILGISGSTINKIFGKGTIHEFSVQLANKYFDKPETVLGKEFALTTKIDGMRCIVLKENGKVSFWSRQGQPIEGLVDLLEESVRLPDNICLDGELVAKETSKEDTYKNTMKSARTKDAEKHNLKMMVFDCMPLEDFKNQRCVLTYKERRTLLDTFLHSMQYFELLPLLYVGTDTNKIEEFLNDQVSKGEEGIMINICEALYVFGRTSNLLKVKLFNSCDLRIVGLEEGTNKNSNTLGALLLEYKNNIVKCGSGFTDEQRDEIWNNQEKYLNTIVEITYFEETTNAKGTFSLRFPVFKDFRTDKTEPNY